MTATPAESPELVGLFNAYTHSADSIARHLTELATRSVADAPMLVATSTELVLYPGGDSDPEVLGFRLSTKGFKELAAISHLAPALATLVVLQDCAPANQWRADAENLIQQISRSRAANSVELWRDVIAVDAYRGREEAIAAMVDYALCVVGEYVDRILAEPERLTFEALRTDLLEDGALPVSLNRVMIATFFLVGMDISHRVISWLDARNLDWHNTMVIVAGQQGRATAGVTWQTNSIAGIIRATARGKLPLQNLYIAPHAATFPTPSDGDLSQVRKMEQPMRQLWAGTRSVIDLADQMFPDYPAFSPEGAAETLPTNSDAETVSEMPPISGPDDWKAMVTRLRVVMEDPRRLLSDAVTDYAAAQMVSSANDPARIVVPGLDSEPYPPLDR